MALRGIIGQGQPTFGQTLGQTLGPALLGLAEGKAQEMAYKRQLERSAKGFEPLLENKQAALAVASLPPELQKFALQNPDALRTLLGGQSQYQKSAADTGQSILSRLQNLGVQEGPTTEQQQYLAQLANPFFRPQQPMFGQQMQEQPQQQMQEQYQQQLSPQLQNDKAQILADLFTSPAEKARKEELELKRQKSAREGRREEREEKEFERKYGAKQKEETAELVNTRKSLNDFIDTAERALKYAKTAKFNPATAYLAGTQGLQGQLDPDTAAFNTEASKLFNIEAGLLGGRANVERLKGLGKEKASLGKSREENIRYLQNAIKVGKQQRQIFDKENPDIVEKYKATEQESNYKGYDAYQENGKYYKWDPATDQYREAKLKGK